MKKWFIRGIFAALVTGMVLMSGCTTTGSTEAAPVAILTPQIVNETVLVIPPQTPTISPTSTQSTQDPIIGSWLNGMVFYANGTVGSDGTTSWQINKNEKNSYFIIFDVPSGEANNKRIVISTEWIYNPASDAINKRGSSESFSRGIPTPVAKPIPPFTTIQTPTTALPLAVGHGTGTLSIRTGSLGMPLSVFIAPEGANVPLIDNSHDPYKYVAGGQNPGYIEVKVLPDGCAGSVSLAPGKYIAYLPDKNGGQPEQQSFTINANSNTVISFVAYSYRSSSGGGCRG